MKQVNDFNKGYNCIIASCNFQYQKFQYSTNGIEKKKFITPFLLFFHE